ncbi:MAG: glucose 1-dehydrogenase [Alphaproteobacteria bacterium]|nr:glucose 1-dehydrogenase [Alphaproteobacteria bacterium]
MDLKNQVAVVTGSATGLGAAVVLKLAELGANVVVNYTKSLKEAEETLALAKSKDVDAVLAQGDVGNDEDCRRIAKAAVDRWGRIDMLVNNAGTTKFADHADLDALNADDFLNIYKVNVVGAFQMIRACAPQLKARKFGRVVNISSIAGVLGVGSSVAYAASKGALNTMTKSLARSLAPEIRVNAVCPGFIGTRWFSERFGPETYARIVEHNIQSTPLQRAGTPEDVADAVVFFCTEGALHITGETLLSDAGHHLALAGVVRR